MESPRKIVFEFWIFFIFLKFPIFEEVCSIMSFRVPLMQGGVFLAPGQYQFPFRFTIPEGITLRPKWKKYQNTKKTKIDELRSKLVEKKLSKYEITSEIKWDTSSHSSSKCRPVSFPKLIPGCFLFILSSHRIWDRKEYHHFSEFWKVISLQRMFFKNVSICKTGFKWALEAGTFKERGKQISGVDSYDAEV